MSKQLRIICMVSLALLLFTGTAHAIESLYKDVKFIDGSTSENHKTTAETVAEFFQQNDITIYDKDILNVNLNDQLSTARATEIKILRGFDVNVIIDGKSERVKVSQGTKTGNVISKLETENNQSYVFDGSYAQELVEDDKIILATKRSETIIEKEIVPFQTQTIENEELDQGVTKVVTEGAEGEREIETLIQFISDKEVSREIVSEKIVKEPIDKIIHKGTKPPVKTEIGDLNYTNVYTMSATAYTAGYESTGKRPGDRGYGITSSGMKAERGVVAVDTNLIPMGTKLFIEGYGVSIAGDSSASIRGNKIDLFFDTTSECYKFGRRNVKVYVLK